MPSYGGAPRMSRLLTAGLWVLGLAAVLVPPGLAQERWGDWDWWDQTTPTAVQERLDHGADPTVRYRNGLTPLHMAVRSNANPAVAALLLEHGADLTAQAEYGGTPLHMAVYNANPAVAALLLDRGADLTARDRHGMTPLQRAAGYNANPAVAAVLLDHGADLTARDMNGLTPLHMAAGYNDTLAVTALLLDHGADLTARDRDGETPLHWAAKHRTPEVVAVLLDHGADAALRDNQNKLPADYAAENTALQGTAVYQRLLAVPSAAPGSLAAQGDGVAQPSSRSAAPPPNCHQLMASGQRPTRDDVTACLEAHSCGAYREWDPELETCVRTAAAPVWDTDLLRNSCGAYREWDPELEACARTAEPLPPELEWFGPLNRPLVRPPAGVIVLHTDGTWSEAAACPPELLEEQPPVNNWRFCRDPYRRDRIPRMWNPPINGIPYEEAEKIFETHKETLSALPGVASIGLGLQSIGISTGQPDVVPDAVEGIPIQTMPPIYGYPLPGFRSLSTE